MTQRTIIQYLGGGQLGVERWSHYRSENGAIPQLRELQNARRRWPCFNRSAVGTPQPKKERHHQDADRRGSSRGKHTLMAGKTVLVTGATGGIGKATTVGLARVGARVGITGRDIARAEAAATDIGWKG
jgi:hypothetical protein